MSGLSVSDNWLYATKYIGPANFAHSLHVADVTDKYDPQFVGAVSSAGNAFDVFSNEDEVFVAGCARGMMIYERNVPNLPVLRSETGDWNLHIAFREDTAFMSMNNYGYQIWEFSNPAAPTFVSEAPEHYGVLCSAVDGDFAYLLEINWNKSTRFGFPHFLRILDISDITAPKTVGHLQVGEANFIYLEIAKAYDHVYIPLADSLLHIVDVSDPQNPELAGTYQPAISGSCHYVTFANNYLYLSVTVAMSVEMLSLADPTSPQLVDVVTLHSPIEHTHVQDDYLYVCATHGVHLFRVNPPPVACGDIDGNGAVNVSDVVYLINFVFGDGELPAGPEVADVDCNALINVSDVVYLIAYVFGDGAEPCADCP
jgi:hypothetical protein